ncbi:MAG: hypothetical protein KDA58_08050, partial [Planctomycetaceae bacterium]|nr:hypothetical protein [Planctomycetaceae bacterium]
QSPPIRLLGPAPAPVMKLKKHYRYHFLLYAPSVEAIQQLWHQVLPQLSVPKDVEFMIDVDPLDMR